MWFRKRTDPEAMYVANQCGIKEEFECVGEVLHRDDLEMLRQQLFKVSSDTMMMLFSETTL